MSLEYREPVDVGAYVRCWQRLVQVESPGHSKEFGEPI